MIKIRMIESIIITSWNYDGSFFSLKAGNFYTIPLEVAQGLQAQGYCYWIEKIRENTKQ